MKAREAEIAIATVSGKTYYWLVKELKQRRIPFLSLLPGDHVPFNIKTVITTKGERHLVEHSRVLVFQDETVPTVIVDEAVRAARGKQSYDKIIIGIDPGKTFGIAAIADGKVFETVSCSNLKETVNTVLEFLDRAAATVNVVKIGNGAPICAEKLVHLLDMSMPKQVILETVSEARTSHFARETTHRRGPRDVMSAIEIAKRTGQALHRKRMVYSEMHN